MALVVVGVGLVVVVAAMVVMVRYGDGGEYGGGGMVKIELW